MRACRVMCVRTRRPRVTLLNRVHKRAARCFKGSIAITMAARASSTWKPALLRVEFCRGFRCEGVGRRIDKVRDPENAPFHDKFLAQQSKHLRLI